MNQALTEIEQKAKVEHKAKRRWLWGLWKWLVGAVTCQSPLFAMVGAGWGYRLAERSALGCPLTRMTLPIKSFYRFNSRYNQRALDGNPPEIAPLV